MEDLPLWCLQVIKASFAGALQNLFQYKVAENWTLAVPAHLVS